DLELLFRRRELGTGRRPQTGAEVCQGQCRQEFPYGRNIRFHRGFPSEYQGSDLRKRVDRNVNSDVRRTHSNSTVQRAEEDAGKLAGLSRWSVPFTVSAG